jgi:AraC family transcriptional regulator
LLQEARRTYWKKSHSASVPGDAFLFPYPCITSSPSIDTLHLHLYSTTQNNSLGRSTLKLEELATELVKEVFVQIYGQNDSSKYALTNKEREQHLEIIERAKHYMVGDFDQNLSLADVARQAHASVFHFSRIFKQFTHQSPYQYLMDVRLKHAAMLLRNTSLSITEICFSSGFNSFSHFISTFTRRYGQSPSKFRAA